MSVAAESSQSQQNRDWKAPRTGGEHHKPGGHLKDVSFHSSRTAEEESRDLLADEDEVALAAQDRARKQGKPSSEQTASQREVGLLLDDIMPGEGAQNLDEQSSGAASVSEPESRGREISSIEDRVFELLYAGDYEKAEKELQYLSMDKNRFSKFKETVKRTANMYREAKSSDPDYERKAGAILTMNELLNGEQITPTPQPRGLRDRIRGLFSGGKN